MPSRPGHPHSENLSRMEVSQPLPAAEEQSDSGGSVVPSICGQSLHRHNVLQLFKEKALADYHLIAKRHHCYLF